MSFVGKILVTALFKGYTDAEFDAKLKEDGMIYLFVDSQNHVRIDDMQKGKRRATITLYPKGKELKLREGTVGDKIQPATQQLLQFLRKEKIIDDSWKVRGDEYSKYVGYDFKTFPSKYSKDFDFLTDQRNRLTDGIKDIRLYHGTSSQDWEKIQKVGLFPLNKGTNKEGGFESRHKHEGNENVLYLTGSLKAAQQYAQTRCSSLENKAKKAGKYIKLEPIVLEVRIPDARKLVADDDIVNGVAREQARKLWDKKSDAEKADLKAKLTESAGFEVRDDSTAQMLWRETDAGFNEIMKTIPKMIYKAWLASLKRQNQVGYRGRIPASFITKLD